MQPLINDATGALLRAIHAAFAGFPGATIEEISSRAWASATFAGARHELALRLEGEGAEQAADALTGRLAAAEFRLRGHLVADIALISEERGAASDGGAFVRMRIEALTVEDR